jgi:hypothetical protein
MDYYWPLLAVATADGVLWIGTRIHKALARSPRTSRFPLQASAFVVFLLALTYTSAVQGTLWRQMRQLDTRKETILLNPEPGAAPLPLPLRVLGIGLPMRWSYKLRSRTIPHLVGVRVREHAVYARERRDTWRPYEDMNRGILPRDAVAGTVAAGAMPFYLPDLTVIDMLGLADRTIARNPVTTPNSRRMIAHDRRPPPGYLQSRGVNINVLPPARSAEEALSRAPFAVPVGAGLWMPFETSDPAWATRSFSQAGLVSRTAETKTAGKP